MRSMGQVISSLGDSRITLLDEILRAGHARYMQIPQPIRMEHDSRAQAAATYCHIVAEAERRFDQMDSVRPIEINGFKLWVIEDCDAVVSFKKMDKNGTVRSYDTAQCKKYNMQQPLPGLPTPPIRLRVGYLLDEFSTDYVRTQIAVPNGRNVLWCAGIHPPEERLQGEPIWFDVAEQIGFAV